jgi:hypothetical protein
MQIAARVLSGQIVKRSMQVMCDDEDAEGIWKGLFHLCVPDD